MKQLRLQRRKESARIDLWRRRKQYPCKKVCRQSQSDSCRIRVKMSLKNTKRTTTCWRDRLLMCQMTSHLISVVLIFVSLVVCISSSRMTCITDTTGITDTTCICVMNLLFKRKKVSYRSECVLLLVCVWTLTLDNNSLYSSSSILKQLPTKDHHYNHYHTSFAKCIFCVNVLLTHVLSIIAFCSLSYVLQSPRLYTWNDCLWKSHYISREAGRLKMLWWWLLSVYVCQHWWWYIDRENDLIKTETTKWIGHSNTTRQMIFVMCVSRAKNV